MQLQDSCRESKSDVNDLRQENARLRHEFREREKLWKALWQARKNGDPEDFPPPPPSFSPSHSHQNLNTALISPSHANQYSDETIAYRAPSDASGPMCRSYATSAPTPTYPTQSPSLSYASASESIPADASHTTSGKYGYSYPLQNDSHRDGHWHGSNRDSGAPTSNGSPAYVTSPTLTSSDMSYVQRYPMEDQKVPLSHLESAQYVLPNSRSLSPSSSTPTSTSSTSLTSPFQFNFPEGSMAHERPGYDDYRRPPNSHSSEVPLHAGGPDISLAGPGSDAVRYRLGARRANSGDNRPVLPALPQAVFSGSDGSQNDRGSSEGESGPYNHQRPRSRRDEPLSRSPSPGTPPISGTLAVIKAQAFGALRRTRTRSKKSGDVASRAAMEALEARGIGLLGVPAGHKRPRLDIDDGDYLLQ